MPRELSPNLFGGPNEADLGVQKCPVDLESGQEGTSAEPLLIPQHTQHLDSVEAQVFTAHLEGLKDRIQQLSQKIEVLELKSRSDEGSQQIKVERFQTSLKHLEAVIRQHVNDMNGKFAQVVSRFNNQKMNESKIEQMLDRHSQVVQNFEVKMHQMQKVISEQELQLINYKSALDEARKQLASLKKL